MGNLKDYATALVATAPSPATSGTDLVVTSTHGARYPATPFYATAHPVDQLPTLDNSEKIEVTNITTDTLTIVRGQGDTTAKSIAVGWRISNAIFTDDIPVVKADVGLGNVDNTSNATERAATASLTNKDLSASSNTFPDFYPVGTIYENKSNSANPSTYLPGQSGNTWVAITDKFIVARGGTYSGTGGSATHTHALTGARANVSPLGIGASSNIYYDLDTGTTFTSTHRTITNNTTQTSIQTTSGSSRLQGSTDSASTIPPYQAVYVWERTA